MKLASWRAAVRIARRDAAKHKARSALIVAMVALPVLALAGADVLARSGQLSPQEKLTRQIGHADAAISASGRASIEQSPKPDGDRVGKGHGPDTLSGADVRRQVPEATKVLSDRTGGATLKTRYGVAHVSARELDYADPLARGILVQRAGRAPHNRREVAVTTKLADRLGIGVDDTVRTAKGSRSFTVVGTVADPSSLSLSEVVGLPGSLPFDKSAEGYGPPTTRHLIGVPGAVTWPQVVGLNKHGVQVTSRHVVLHPPPDSAVPYYRHRPHFTDSGTDPATIGLAILAVGIATLEVVLLAGAAFAVGTRRQRRDLALVAACGGSARQVRSVVLAGGGLLGLVGAVVGIAVGIVVAVATTPAMQRLTGSLFGHLDLRPGELAAVAVLGLLTGILAAVVPARQAANQEVVAALTGRRGAVRSSRRVVIGGLVAIGVGAVVALYAAKPPTNFTLLLAGAVIGELGFVACAPALVALTSRLGRWLPLAPRLALRDAGRHRGRSGPAVAAVLTVVAGSIAISTYVASNTAHGRALYQPRLLPGQAVLYSNPKRPPAAAPAVADALGARVVQPKALGRSCTHRTHSCGRVTVQTHAPQGCPRHDAPHGATSRGDTTALASRCRALPFADAPIAIGGAKVVHALTGHRDPDAVAALRAGKIIVISPTEVRHGHATLRVRRHTRKGPSRSPKVPLPAYVSAVDGQPGSAYAAAVAAETAHRLGLGSSVQFGPIFDAGGPPTDAQLQAADKVLAHAGLSPSNLYVERGYVGGFGYGLLALALGSAIVTIGATAIATGLALAEARPDLSTLGAVGAGPRVRRTLAASQAGVVAVLGVVFGSLAGLGLAYTIVISQQGWPFAMPWPTLAGTVVGLPAFAAGIAWVLTRSRTPLDRRLT